MFDHYECNCESRELCGLSLCVAKEGLEVEFVNVLNEDIRFFFFLIKNKTVSQSVCIIDIFYQ